MQYVEFLIHTEAELTCSCYALTGGGAFIDVSPTVRTSKHVASHAFIFLAACQGYELAIRSRLLQLSTCCRVQKTETETEHLTETKSGIFLFTYSWGKTTITKCVMV